MDDLNLENLTLPNVPKIEFRDNKSLPRHKNGEKFLKGPIPLDWLNMAAKLPGKALHVAIAIWFLAGIKKMRTIALSGSVLNGMGVKRNAAYRALAELEGAGLISVIRYHGRLSEVTILEWKG